MKRIKTVRQPKKGNVGYDALYNLISEIAKSMVALDERSMAAYGPIVNDIINSRSKDNLEIQRTLDGMLGFCGTPAMLLLYKKLCRYYFDLDPAATADYIGYYREMWDPESLKKDVSKSKKK